MKRRNWPKNVKAGRTIEQAREYVSRYSDKLPDGVVPLITISCYNHGRDVNGNGTSHYVCTLVWPSRVIHGPVFDIVKSGYRREQVGYSGMHESAMYALSLLGFELDTSKAGSYDYQGKGTYPITNWPLAK